MADGTHIEWTDSTWNPITGCSIVSKGCTNCYAMKLAGTRLQHHPSRAGLTKMTNAGPVWTGEVRFNEQWLDQPLRWRRPRKIFVCAHGDLFAEGVPDEWIDRVFAVMALCPQHTFQILTKRPARMRGYIGEVRATWTKRGPPVPGSERIYDAALAVTGEEWLPATPAEWPLPNVWLGVSAEDQATADERIPHLLATPAAVRFVSAEPLLGPIDFEPWLPWPGDAPEVAGKSWGCQDCDSDRGCDCPLGKAVHNYEEGPTGEDGAPSWIAETRLTLDQIIVGGESGPNARPMHPAWARSIRDQSQAAGAAFFFKQMTRKEPIPSDLLVREWPHAKG
jgi:protein gp37